MGYLQSVRRRLGSAARFVGQHAGTVGRAALGAAVLAGAALGAHRSEVGRALRQQSEGRRLARRDGAELRRQYEEDRRRAREVDDEGYDAWEGYTGRPGR